jgi:hypothetical protein
VVGSRLVISVRRSAFGVFAIILVLVVVLVLEGAVVERSSTVRSILIREITLI